MPFRWCVLSRQQMAGALAAQQPAAWFSSLEDVKVADPGPHQGHARLQRHPTGHVGHQCTHRARHALALTWRSRTITYSSSSPSNSRPPASTSSEGGIAIQGQAVVRARIHRRAQRLGRGGANAGVDVQANRLGTPIDTTSAPSSCNTSGAMW